MESYEEFVRRLSPHGGEDDEDEPARPSSVIVFHGAPVLPPLLDERQRLEIRSLREAAVRLRMMMMKRRRRREEEALSGASSQFAEVRISEGRGHTGGGDDITDSDITSSAPPPLLTCHPLTSTTQDGGSANQLRASPEAPSLENTQITVLFEGHKSVRSHDLTAHDRSRSQVMSSGYVTNDNTDVSWTKAGTARLNTTTGSDIISHAPVDGAVLEQENAVPAPEPKEDATEPTNPPSDPDEGPYRMSLQNLLKKSQEYRRRQRLLRSQAKAPNPPADELSLSDKENEERPGRIWRTELKNARERRKTEEDAGTDASDRALHDPDALIQPTSTLLPVPARTRPAAVSACRSASSRFPNIPAPALCLSPVRCKRGGAVPGPVRRAVTDADLRMRTSAQTQQIAQLELNLCSLRALISDLESTLTHPTGSHGDGGSTPPPAPSPTEAVRREGSGLRGGGAAVGVLTDTSNHWDRSGPIGSSYDVDAPSSLWSQLTPETGGHEGVSRVKRRLVMNAGEREAESGASGVMSSALEGHVTALVEDERRRQQDLLQSLAERYQFLRSVSFPCPGADSRLEDTLTSVLSSSVCTHTELSARVTHTNTQQVCVSGSGLPLLAALVKGFLTRRLLNTERVSRLATTIKDSQALLWSLQQQSCVSSRSEQMLQERVTLQLRSARHELHQLLFSSSSSERMRMIRLDRELRRERRLQTHARLKAPLSAATRKALERRKRMMLQQRSADRKRSGEDRWSLGPQMCSVSRRNTPLRGAR